MNTSVGWPLGSPRFPNGNTGSSARETGSHTSDAPHLGGHALDRGTQSGDSQQEENDSWRFVHDFPYDIRCHRSRTLGYGEQGDSIAFRLRLHCGLHRSSEQPRNHRSQWLTLLCRQLLCRLEHVIVEIQGRSQSRGIKHRASSVKFPEIRPETVNAKFPKQIALPHAIFRQTTKLGALCNDYLQQAPYLNT